MIFGKHDYQGMIGPDEYGLMEKPFYNYAYMSGTENDAKVQHILKSMRHIFGLAELI